MNKNLIYFNYKLNIILTFFLPSIILLLIYISCINFSYESLKTFGILNDNKIMIEVPLNIANKMDKKTSILIGCKEYKITQIKYEDTTYKNNIYMQELYIYTPYKSKIVNKPLELTILYGKKRNINKLIGGFVND